MSWIGTTPKVVPTRCSNYLPRRRLRELILKSLYMKVESCMSSSLSLSHSLGLRDSRHFTAGSFVHETYAYSPPTQIVSSLKFSYEVALSLET